MLSKLENGKKAMQEAVSELIAQSKYLPAIELIKKINIYAKELGLNELKKELLTFFFNNPEYAEYAVKTLEISRDAKLSEWLENQEFLNNLITFLKQEIQDPATALQAATAPLCWIDNFKNPLNAALMELRTLCLKQVEQVFELYKQKKEFQLAQSALDYLNTYTKKEKNEEDIVARTIDFIHLCIEKNALVAAARGLSIIPENKQLSPPIQELSKKIFELAMPAEAYEAAARAASFYGFKRDGEVSDELIELRQQSLERLEQVPLDNLHPDTKWFIEYRLEFLRKNSSNKPAA